MGAPKTRLILACPCCDGEGVIYVEDVAAEYLVSWRNHDGIEAEFLSRGDIAWVRDCAGAIMPGNEADIAGGCEILEMVVSIAQAAE